MSFHTEVLRQIPKIDAEMTGRSIAAFKSNRNAGNSA